MSVHFGEDTVISFLEKQGFIDDVDIEDMEFNERVERANALATGYVLGNVTLPFDMRVIAEHLASSDANYFSSLHRKAALRIYQSI